MEFLNQLLEWMGLGGLGAGSGAVIMNMKTKSDLKEELAAFRLHVAEKYVTKDALETTLKPLSEGILEIKGEMKIQSHDIKELLKK